MLMNWIAGQFTNATVVWNPYRCFAAPSRSHDSGLVVSTRFCRVDLTTYAMVICGINFCCTFGVVDAP